MAWSFIDSGQNKGVSSATDFVVTLPSYSSGDIAIISAYRDQDLGDWLISSSGWELLASNRAASGRDRSTALFYKVLGSSESNPTITYSNSNSEEWSWTIHIFRTSVGSLSNTYIIDDWRFSSGANIQNPTAPSVTTSQSNTCVVTFQMQTHDDITGWGAPSGFTLGETIGSSSLDNRLQAVAYDLDVGAQGSKTFGAWQSSWNNTASEYSVYTVAFATDPLVGVTDVNTDEQLDVGEADCTITGFGFESSQGSGKIELWSDTVGTTKQMQTVQTWGDTALTFDVVKGSIPEGICYIVVTNDTGDVSSAYIVSLGYGPYNFGNLVPDFMWTMNNTYEDTGVQGDHPCDNAGSGTTFVTTPICRSNEYSMLFDAIADSTEVADSGYTNLSATHGMRNVGGWMQVDRLQMTPACIYEEGGGVNNLYFVLGFGNILLANMADSNKGTKIQAFSDKTIAINRPYHIMLRYEATVGDGYFYMYVDGVRQAKTTGNPIIVNEMSVHSGDWAFGKPDSNLDTGGTDIAYNAANNLLLAQWATWSDTGGGCPLTESEIRVDLFEKGALADVTIASDTEANMQLAVDALADTIRPDYPCAIKIEGRSGGGDLRLEADNITFDPNCSIDIMYMGTTGTTLTWVLKNGSKLDMSKISTVQDGIIETETQLKLTITGILSGSIVSIFDNEVVNLGNFDTRLSHIASSGTSYNYSHDGGANDIIVQIMKAGYEEIKILYSLNSTDQVLNITQKLELN